MSGEEGALAELCNRVEATFAAALCVEAEETVCAAAVPEEAALLAVDAVIVSETAPVCMLPRLCPVADNSEADGAACASALVDSRTGALLSEAAAAGPKESWLAVPFPEAVEAASRTAAEKAPACVWSAEAVTLCWRACAPCKPPSPCVCVLSAAGWAALPTVEAALPETL